MFQFGEAWSFVWGS